MATTATRTLTLKSSVSIEITNAFRFKTYCKKPHSFKAEIVNFEHEKYPLDFVLEGGGTVNGTPATSEEGVELAVNVRFDPSKVGETRAILRLSSPDAGDYTCLLQGHAAGPQAKGPFKISQKGFDLDFRNPFHEAADFAVKMDNPAFSVTGIKTSVRVDAKKVQKLPVVFKKTEG